MSIVDDVLTLIGEAARDEQDGRDAAREIVALVRGQSFRPPPRRAVAKLVRRLERMDETGITAEDVGLPKSKLSAMPYRASFAIELGYVLRDYRKLLEQLADFYVLGEDDEEIT